MLYSSQFIEYGEILINYLPFLLIGKRVVIYLAKGDNLLMFLIWLSLQQAIQSLTKYSMYILEEDLMPVTISWIHSLVLLEVSKTNLLKYLCLQDWLLILCGNIIISLFHCVVLPYIKINFFPATTHLWNNLPQNIRDSPSNYILQSRLKTLYNNPVKTSSIFVVWFTSWFTSDKFSTLSFKAKLY